MPALKKAGLALLVVFVLGVAWAVHRAHQRIDRIDQYQRDLASWRTEMERYQANSEADAAARAQQATTLERLTRATERLEAAIREQ